MTKNRIIRAICASFVSVVAINIMPVIAAEDSDGCWSGRHSAGSCLEYRTYREKNMTYIELTNVCNARLYVKWIFENEKSGSADGLDAGQTKKKSTYMNSSRARAVAVGSNKPLKDWVCADKVDDWDDF